MKIVNTDKYKGRKIQPMRHRADLLRLRPPQPELLIVEPVQNGPKIVKRQNFIR